MAILSDGVHLVSDTSIEELHEAASEIGLKRTWFQSWPEHRVPHYDLMSDRLRKAAGKRAEIVSSREIVRRAVRA